MNIVIIHIAQAQSFLVVLFHINGFYRTILFILNVFKRMGGGVILLFDLFAEKVDICLKLLVDK